MPPAKRSEWTNDVIEPSARDLKIGELADKAKAVEPKLYSVTSKNRTATRVIHDHNGNQISIPPGETREGVLLHPFMIDTLMRGDLNVTAASAS